ncbi:MAG: hypothetical protein JXA07_09890 [Spirochaetes bacterium]|nr:hypothetical protein [Spirochaetota bacterium]
MKRFLIILLAVSVMSVFGCKKSGEGDAEIEKLVPVKEYAESAKELINEENASKTADDLLKEVEKDLESE